MSYFQKIDKPPRVLVKKKLINLSESILYEVEKLWQEELAIQSNLFNGTIYSVTNYSINELVVSPLEYKFWIAQRRNPELFGNKKICPLAITGLTQSDGAILFAQRSDRVTQDQGLWELAPAGGVDGDCFQQDDIIDLSNQVYKELLEELGVQMKETASVKSYGVFFDPVVSVLDVVYWVELNISQKVLEERLKRGPKNEHYQFKFILKDHLGDFLKNNEALLSPLIKSIWHSSVVGFHENFISRQR